MVMGVNISLLQAGIGAASPWNLARLGKNRITAA
jgi:hypothetical protein